MARCSAATGPHGYSAFHALALERAGPRSPFPNASPLLGWFRSSKNGGDMNQERPHPDWPLAAAYGLGVNSTALLVELVNRQVRPDLILFADTGGEKPETYAYLPVIQRYLKRVGFPPVVTVRYEPKTAPYRTLEGQCRHTGTLPSLAYGGRSCSAKWKRQPQDSYILRRFPPGAVTGKRVV